jgi:hypothetical protein
MFDIATLIASYIYFKFFIVGKVTVVQSFFPQINNLFSK